MANTYELSIVSPVDEMYSGPAEKLFVTGVLGELEILAGHAPLLTQLAPGPVWVYNGEKREGFVIFGGMLEVQPDITIVLADICQRAAEIDEAAAIEAKDAAMQALEQNDQSVDHEQARSEINIAVAKLRLLNKIKQFRKQS